MVAGCHRSVLQSLHNKIEKETAVLRDNCLAVLLSAPLGGSSTRHCLLRKGARRARLVRNRSLPVFSWASGGPSLIIVQVLLGPGPASRRTMGVGALQEATAFPFPTQPESGLQALWQHVPWQSAAGLWVLLEKVSQTDCHWERTTNAETCNTWRVFFAFPR